MKVRPIRTRRDHAAAIREIDRLMGARKGTPAADRLDVLVALVSAYEAVHDRIELPHPIDAVRVHMAERGLSQTDLALLLGSRSLASSILGRKRAMSLEVIRKIAAAWDIPVEILVQRYRLLGVAGARKAA
jgi:HTH-type transcriptional regulator/antitoxin HigA